MATPKLSVSLIAVGIVGIILIVFGGIVTNSAEEAIKKKDKTEEKKETSTSEDIKGEELIGAIRMHVGDQKFWVDIDSSPAGQEFAKAVPFSLKMKDNDRVEKEYCGDETLPTDESYQPGVIRAGDVMLRGNKCIVIFYKEVETDDTYVRLGRINDSDRLQQWLDEDKSASIKFTKQ